MPRCSPLRGGIISLTSGRALHVSTGPTVMIMDAAAALISRDLQVSDVARCVNTYPPTPPQR